MSRALIIGAGIGGTSAAIALARRGWQVEIWEQAPAAEEVGAGLQVSPNAFRVLDAWGLGNTVRTTGSKPKAAHMRDDRTGRHIGTIHFARAETCYGTPYVQIHRADLLEILLKAAEDAGVTFSFGKRVDGVADLPERDLVIGADGVRSTLRTYVAGASTPLFSGQIAWRGLIPVTHLSERPDPQITQLWLGPGRHMVAYCLRGGTLWNVVAVEERDEWTEEGWRAAADPADLQRAFADACPEVRLLLDRVEDCIIWGLFGHQPLDRWTRKNIALLGDAAHPMLPFVAQGAAQSIEDAYVLAATVDPEDIETSLETYEAKRKHRATRVQHTAQGNAGIYHKRGPARHALHAAITLRSLLPGGLLSRFDWLYGEDVTQIL